jgi:hypothetical protein
MRLNLLAALATALALTVLPASAGAASDKTPEVIETVKTLAVDGSLVVSPQGTVESYAITTPLTPGVQAIFDKTIPTWRFEVQPGADGTAQRIEARMRISLAAAKAEKDYQVRIENVTFRPMDAPEKVKGESRGPVLDLVARKMNPPVYPRELQRAGVSGRVLLGIRFAPDGSVADVVPVQSMLYDVDGRDRVMQQAIRMLERASVDAARRWSASVQAKSDAPTTAKDYTVTTAIEFILDTGPSKGSSKPPEERPGMWRQVSRTPRREMPWLSGLKDVQAVGVADVDPSQTQQVSLAGVPKLMTPVVGSTL